MPEVLLIAGTTPLCTFLATGAILFFFKKMDYNTNFAKQLVFGAFSTSCLIVVMMMKEACVFEIRVGSRAYLWFLSRFVQVLFPSLLSS